jgi:4-amino-4-deoxy-L-arabinose transferase-like glycosyltransferase
MRRMQENRRNRRRALWAVLGAGAAIRALYLADVLSHPLLAEFVILDAKVYDTTADRIARGDWLGGDTAYPLGPLYFYFLAVERLLLGGGTTATYVVQQLMGLGSLFLTASIARRCFGERAGIAAAALLAVYAPIMMLETKLLSSTLAIFLCVVCVALLLRARDEGWSLGCFLPGLALGLACLARPNTILFAPVAVLWMSTGSTARKWPAALFLAAGIAAGILPATLRNYAVEGEFVLISTHGGFVFYQANRESSLGLYSRVAGFSGDPSTQARDQLKLAERALGYPPTYAQADRYWFRKGLDSLIHNPGDALVLEWRKLHLWLGSEEASGQYVLAMERDLTPTLWLAPLPFGVLLALALLGVRATGSPDSRQTIVYLFVLVNLGSVLIFHFASRYRAPAVPFVCAIAGAGCIELVDRVRHRRHGLVLWLAAAVALGAFSLYPWTNHTRIQGANEYTNLGNEFADRDRHAEAIASYREALKVLPREWKIHLNLANSYYQLGDLSSALHHYGRVVEINPHVDMRPQIEHRMARLRQKTVE